MQTACCILKESGTREEEIRMCQAFQVVSVGNGELARQCGAIPYGQFRPTDPNYGWSQWVRNYGIRRWLTDYKLDLLMMDMAFDFGDPVAAIAEIAVEAAPVPVMPNFGDFDTWTGAHPARPEYGPWARALQVYPWHFVQVAYKAALHTTERWRTLRYHANLRLAAGKTLVLGIYDPGRKNEMLSALLMASFQHPRLYWHYQVGLPDDPPTLDNNINTYWGLSR